MATSTFDKEIIIDDISADRIIDVLNKPVSKWDINEDELKRSGEALAWLRLNLKTLSVPKRN